MSFIDYYKVLGVERNATQEEIRKAFRKLVKKYHTDKNESPDAKQRFQEINEANQVLSDPEKRKKYDEYGEHWRHADEFEAGRRQYGSNFGQGFGGFDGFGDFSRSAGNNSEFSDFFESLFGNRGFSGFGGTQRKAGRDLQTELSLKLNEITATQKRIITVNGNNIRLTIPAGITDGQKIRLKGQGGEAPGSTSRGDLYITFRIEPDPLFKREGNDLHTTITADLYTLLLGGEITVPTLDGSVRIHIKPGTQPDTRLRLKGKGLPQYKNEENKGDLYVTIKLTLPTLNERQKELLQELKNAR